MSLVLLCAYGVHWEVTVGALFKAEWNVEVYVLNFHGSVLINKYLILNSNKAKEMRISDISSVGGFPRHRLKAMASALFLLLAVASASDTLYSAANHRD